MGFCQRKKIIIMITLNASPSFRSSVNALVAIERREPDEAMIATCVECGDIFPAKRVDASCCSPRCRKAKSRRPEGKRPLRNARETPSTMDRAWAPAWTSASLNVTDNRSSLLKLILRPHVEERGNDRFHLDRFDAYLDGALILTSRQPWHDGARELLRRGYPEGSRQLRAAAQHRLSCSVVVLGLHTRQAKAHPLAAYAGTNEAACRLSRNAPLPRAPVRARCLRPETPLLSQRTRTQGAALPL
jgi:hypothetical protein